MSTTLVQSFPPVNDLPAYLRAIDAVPLLSASEERELAMRFREHRDGYAAWRLVVSHLRFVVKFARQYAGYGLPEEDLIQQGNVGLMKAVRRYKPEAGVRLLSYAVHWIRAEIHEFILKNWRIVKVASTGAQRKLFFKLRSRKQRLEWLRDEEAERLAGRLGVDADDVRCMEQRLYTRDHGFEAGEGQDSEGLAPSDYLTGGSDPASLVAETQWRDRCSRKLSEALSALDERSRDIVSRRWLQDDKTCLRTLAEEYGVSVERVRQIEKRALGKLRGALQQDAGFSVRAP